MRVTVTGANGFIGQHLVNDQLARGRKVCAVDVSLSQLNDLKTNPLIELVQADVRDIKAMQKAVSGSKVVFHLASAHLSVTLSDQVYWDVNVEATQKLIEIAHQVGVSRFIHCSSVGVYGEIKNPPADEESPCNPDLIYEETKLAGEQAVLEYYRKTGFPTVVVRPVWVYGPGCHRTEKLIRSIKKGRFIIIGNGETMRHCIYIDDMIASFNLCAQVKEAVGEIFIVGDDSAITINNLVGHIATVVNVSQVNWRIPLFVMKPIAFIIEKLFTAVGKEPMISRRTLKFFTNNTSFNVRKAKIMLGFNPKYGLQEGFSKTYQIMRLGRV